LIGGTDLSNPMMILKCRRMREGSRNKMNNFP
jgi:hypothetical protein